MIQPESLIKLIQLHIGVRAICRRQVIRDQQRLRRAQPEEVGIANIVEVGDGSSRFKVGVDHVQQRGCNRTALQPQDKTITGRAVVVQAGHQQLQCTTAGLLRTQLNVLRMQIGSDTQLRIGNPNSRASPQTHGRCYHLPQLDNRRRGSAIAPTRIGGQTAFCHDHVTRSIKQAIKQHLATGQQALEADVFIGAPVLVAAAGALTNRYRAQCQQVDVLLGNQVIERQVVTVSVNLPQRCAHRPGADVTRCGQVNIAAQRLTLVGHAGRDNVVADGNVAVCRIQQNIASGHDAVVNVDVLAGGDAHMPAGRHIGQINRAADHKGQITARFCRPTQTHILSDTDSQVAASLQRVGATVANRRHQQVAVGQDGHISGSLDHQAGDVAVALPRITGCLQEHIGAETLGSTKEQVATDHPDFTFGLGIAAKNVTVGLYQQVCSRVEMGRNQHIEGLGVGQFAEADGSERASFGSQRQVATTATGPDGQVAEGVRIKGRIGLNIPQQSGTGLQVNPLRPACQLLGGKQRAGCQRQGAGNAVDTAQIGASNVEHHVVLNDGLGALPVTSAVHSQIAADNQAAILQRSTGSTTMLQQCVAIDLGAGQNQFTINQQFEVTRRIQRADVHSTAGINDHVVVTRPDFGRSQTATGEVE